MDWHIGNVWIVLLAMSMAVNAATAMFFFRVEWMLKQEDRDIENVKKLFMSDRNLTWSIDQVAHMLDLTSLRAHMAVKILVELGSLEGTFSQSTRKRVYHVCPALYHSADD